MQNNLYYFSKNFFIEKNTKFIKFLFRCLNNKNKLIKAFKKAKEKNNYLLYIFLYF